MALRDIFRRRPAAPVAPPRDTLSYPNMALLGQQRLNRQFPVYKPTPRTLRYFSRTPYARRAINAIKNPIAMLEWEVRPRKGVAVSSELKRQIEAVTKSLETPNEDDSFRSLLEQVIEDILCGAGAIEHQVGNDPLHPLWMWPVDGLSIQLYPAWSGDANEARYLQTYGYGTFGGSQQGVMLRNDELIYLKPNPTTDRPFGLGPLEVAFESIAALLGAGAYNRKVTTNATPPGILNLGEGVGSDDIAAFRAYWRNDIEGQGRNPIIGGKDPSWIQIRATSDDGLFLKYQEFVVREVATAFDLSPMNMGIERDVNRDTAEVGEDRDRANTVKPYADLFAAHITREAIQGRLGFSQLEFAFLGLDPDDEQANAKTFETEYKNNAITPNEYRAARGKPPIESRWGDLCYADVQIATIAARGLTQNLDPSLGGSDDLLDNPGAADAPKPPSKAGKGKSK